MTCRNVDDMIKNEKSVERDEHRLQFDAAIGERITTLRKRAKLSQKDLAACINVTEGTMSGKIGAGPWYGWELGENAQRLHSTLDVLYGLEEMPPAPITSLAERRRKTKPRGSGTSLYHLPRPIVHITDYRRAAA